MSNPFHQFLPRRLFDLGEMFQKAIQHGRGLFRGLLRLRGIRRTGLAPFHAGAGVPKEVLRHDGVQGEGLMSRLSDTQLW